jgi:hypothetical protein
MDYMKWKTQELTDKLDNFEFDFGIWLLSSGTCSIPHAVIKGNQHVVLATLPMTRGLRQY